MATARAPISRPDTYARLPRSRRRQPCEQQPAHTFKAATGHLPGAYLQLVRIAAARRQLEEGAPSVSRVAASVGWEDPAFFRSVFKRHVGMTPAEYRERFRQRFPRAAL
jgi:transcriptional regulator GlxA family with amidase domain